MKKEDVKIAVFSSSDKEGGAAIVCYNCVKMFLENGYDAIEIVRNKTGYDSFVYEVQKEHKKKTLLQRILKKIQHTKPYRDISADTDPKYGFFGDESESPDMCTIEEIEKAIPFIPNIILVGHTYNLINTRILSEIHKKWNAHVLLSCTDVGVYTGGCHVHWDCKGYINGCKDCPAVLVESRKWEVAETFAKKRRNIIEGNLGVRYANNWLRKEIEQSHLFDGQVMLFSGQETDIDLYHPNNRGIAKQVFGINSDEKVIMNGSTYLSEERKGFKYFCESMNILWSKLSEEKRKKTTLLIIGKNRDLVQSCIDSIPPFNIMIIDYITDMRLMSLAYQATDIFVGTSLEDGGPMMVADSLACGTPIVGFKTGLIADEEILKDGYNGYAVTMRDCNMLAEKIKEILLLSEEEFQIMSGICRELAVNKLSKYKTLNFFSDYIKKI